MWRVCFVRGDNWLFFPGVCVCVEGGGRSMCVCTGELIGYLIVRRGPCVDLVQYTGSICARRSDI